MPILCATFSLAEPCKQNSKLTMPLFVFLVICFFGRGAEAQYGGGNDTIDLAETSTYVFLSDQSAVVQTGGIAGVLETYSIEGQFRLIIDFDTGMASFDLVDANLVDESPFLPTQSLGELFNMAELVGNVVDETTIEFEGKTADGTNTDILLRLIFRDDSVHLTGRTVPPPNSADFFIYELAAVAWKKYGGGSGTAHDPYLIYTAEQMNAIGTEPNDWDKHFKLMADIDLGSFTGTSYNIIGSGSWSEWDNPFTGVFDGNNKKISNFNHSSIGRNRVGIFGYINAPNAEVRDLGLIDPNIDARQGENVGSLVGYLRNGAIINCYAKGGSVWGYEGVGGLVGYGFGGTITNCYTTTSVSGEGGIGGLTGWAGIITNCHATGDVSGYGDVGGLAGNNRGTITNCYSIASVTGTYCIGGLVGDNQIGSITNCYSSASVTGTYYAGGLVGVNWVGTITDCYSSASATGSNSVGGLVGTNELGIITNCYSIGQVDGLFNVGGLVGYIAGKVSASFWNTQTSGQAISAGGMGLTTAEMNDSSTFINAGWNFMGASDGHSDIWAEPEGGGYPILWWQLPEKFGLPAFSGGTGEPNNPYLISTANELNSIGYNPRLMDAHFKLINDIDLTGVDFLTIGTSLYPFTGTLDGNGKKISNLGGTQGLFEYVGGEHAHIKDLGLIDPNIDAEGDGSVGSLVGTLGNGTIINCYAQGGSVSGNPRIGGLVGNNNGRLKDCFSTCSVSGNSDIGGLVGRNSINSSIAHCYSSASVSGSYRIGGLVGLNVEGTIINCYAKGSVSVSYSTAGGLVGRNHDGTIKNCYSVGHVQGPEDVGGLIGSTSQDGMVITSFWDIQTSGQATYIGGIPLQTHEMQTATIFLIVGWDFVDEDQNGTDDIWWILEGQDYPRLWWELSAFSPDPQDGATDVIQSLILHWVPAEPTLQHDIYFGEGKELVANATTESPGIYRGRQVDEMTTYDPGPLEWDKTYYWRIDECSTDAAISKGHVWSFTTANFLVVDDFEDYNDYPPDEIFSTWIDGYNVPENGAIVCYCDMACWWCSRCNPKPVHGGAQSMDIRYDNSGPAYYSEATKTLVYPRDWTEEGVGVLSLWLYGDPNNDAERMYIALNGNAVVYHDNPDAALIDTWTEWTIDLQEFAAKGVNLANVNTITIGFGDKNNIKAGGSGLVFFDDIRLYRPAPSEPEPAPMTSGGFSKARTIPDCGGSWTKKIALLWPLRTDLGISLVVDDE